MPQFKRKYSDSDVKRIASGIPDAFRNHAGNLTKVAESLDLTRTQLDYLKGQYAPISEALQRAELAQIDAVEEELVRWAMDPANRKGHPTPLIFFLKSKRSEVYNPPQRVEDVTGYAKPKDDAAAKDDSSPASRFTLGVVNGGAPPGRDGTQG